MGKWKTEYFEKGRFKTQLESFFIVKNNDETKTGPGFVARLLKKHFLKKYLQ